MQRIIFLVIATGMGLFGLAQEKETVTLRIVTGQGMPLTEATVEWRRTSDSSLVKIQTADTLGMVYFSTPVPADYLLRVSRIGYMPHAVVVRIVSGSQQMPPIALAPAAATLGAVTVVARKPLIELLLDKTIINLEAGITHTGATAMEALEKMPGIAVDRDGNLSLKGRPNVLVLIDGKQTYLGPGELATMLHGMSAAQISRVEIMDQPPARYDAAGNAGIINIITKKKAQKGFNGSISTAYGQGVYPKNNNSLQLNYRSGKFSSFLQYSLNVSRNFTRLYALRSYYEKDGSTLALLLEQPSFLKGKGETHTLRTGADYSISSKTTVGLTFSSMYLTRSTDGSSTARWMDAGERTDSLIGTRSLNTSQWKNGGVSLFFRHAFTRFRELTADLDVLGYRIRGKQLFENTLTFPGSYTEASKADIPSDIAIVSAKADYTEQLKGIKLGAGWKSSHISTDNLAAYAYRDGISWKEDAGRTNQFLYNENIHAAYADAQGTAGKWSVQGGLRYEMTGYGARQVGNAGRKDSSFSRSYNSLFPSLSLSFAADSVQRFSLSGGRRIDRPAFQKLNPFLFIINKYTYQQGNPFYRPQYTWNVELSHLYKSILISRLGYNITRDYFSQLFIADSTGVIVYTEGNLGRVQQFGLSVRLQLAPASWWSCAAGATLNHKKLQGVLWKQYRSSITQYSLSVNNQFMLKKGWSAELTAFYNSRSQQDIQEIVDPAGQVAAGIAKTVLQRQATVKLAVRDMFYTQVMKGITQFQQSSEYFKLTRDTRVVNLSLTWRFGKAMKASGRSQGAAGEEKERVGGAG